MTKEQLTAEQERLKRDFIKRRGYWDTAHEDMLQFGSDLFEAYSNLCVSAWVEGKLKPHQKHLVALAANAAATHLSAERTAFHIRGALEAGATKAEVIETLQLTSVLGMHSFTTGMPTLIDEIQKAGKGDALNAPLDAEKAALKQAFQEKRGYWNEFWDGLLRLNPSFFQNYLNFSALPWASGPLEPKLKEFMYIAIDVATTHLYEPGLRIHIQNALRYGATMEEIVEVYQIVAELGMQTFYLSAPILREELQRLEVG